jgi:GH35 family endo-1,4-beta-xylanase
VKSLLSGKYRVACFLVRRFRLVTSPFLLASFLSLASLTFIVPLASAASASTFYTQQVNAGGQSYTGSGENQWSADQPYSPGSWGYVGGSTYTAPTSISNTADDNLYQSERYGNFSYKFDVPKGSYNVVLDFAEIYWNKAGDRIFDVLIEGTRVLKDYDICASVGCKKGVALSFQDVHVNDGQLNIDFVTVIDNAKVSAISITSSGSDPPVVSLTSPTPSLSPVQVVTSTASGQNSISSEPRYFGVAVSNRSNVWSDRQYLPSVQVYFNQISSENSSKWRNIEATRGTYNWSVVDREIAFAEANAYPYRAHALLWRQALPGWVWNLSMSERRAAADAFITAFMTRYKGRIWQYDLVNEPLHEDMSDLFGSDYLDHFYTLARGLDPAAKLTLNEYGYEYSGDSYFHLASSMKNKGLIDAINFQGHFLSDGGLDAIGNTINWFATLGLPLYITEFDAPDWNDADQLNYYKALLRFFASKSAIRGITLWGFWQDSIWQSGAHIVRNDWTERPSASWLRTEFVSTFLNSSPSAP